MSASADALDPVLEQQLVDARERQTRSLTGREARGRAAITGLFFACALALTAVAGSHRHPAWWLYPTFVLGYALFSSIQVEVGSGLALPTELVFVPMLFVLPAAHVPIVVAVGLLAAAVPEVARGTLSPWRAAVRPASSFFALGPALVFVAFDEPRADWRGGAVLAIALAAQFAFDFAGACLLEWTALGVSPRELVQPLALTFGIDALVAPLAYGMAVADRVQPGALFLSFPLVALLVLLASERRQRLDSVLELSTAYRGTAFLLGDVVEADDAYTGEHSRQVVELVVAVCERLGLGSRDARLAEFAALLHDIGKIRIPSAILNKPGPLTAEERALVDTHTLEGEQLLRRVGGLLSDVGRIVRSCHERWDGNGYPEGLAGEEIPLVARIVACCDAYNAMTTDRPYRRALDPDRAIEELITNRGTQFDPLVVDAVVAVVAG